MGGTTSKLQSHYQGDTYKTIKLPFQNEGDRPYSIESYFTTLRIINEGNTIDTKIESDLNNHLLDKDYKRLLILGKPGIGKSTLIQYICFKWAKGKIWEDKIILEAALKKLLDWTNPKLWSEEDLYKLSNFVYADSKLPSETELNNLRKICAKFFKFASYQSSENWWFPITENNILDIIQTQNTVILLDGFDEITRDDNARAAIGKLLDVFKDTYVIATARPEALARDINGRKLSTCFKIVTNEGFDRNGRNEYIKNRLSNSDPKELIKRIDHDNGLKEMCDTPLNVEILCFLWEDPIKRDVLKQPFTKTNLYDHVKDKLVTLYQNNKEKEMNHDLMKLIQNKNINIKDLMIHFIERIAYEGLFGEVQNVRNIQASSMQRVLVEENAEWQKITENDRIKEKLFIEEVLKLDLLRPVFKDSDLDQQEYYFTHKTFQEYFAGKCIVRSLKSLTTKEQKQQFLNTLSSYKYRKHISESIPQDINESNIEHVVDHREALKFVAGLLPSHENDAEIFWQTMARRDISKLDITHITFLMHLLSQVPEKTNNESKIITYYREEIDKEISVNPLSYKEILIETNYISARTITVLLDIIKNGKKYQIKDSIQILSRISNNHSKKEVVEQLKALLNSSEDEIVEEAIYALGNIAYDNQEYKHWLKEKLVKTDQKSNIIVAVIKVLSNNISNDDDQELIRSIVDKLNDQNPIIILSALRGLDNFSIDDKSFVNDSKLKIKETLIKTLVNQSYLKSVIIKDSLQLLKKLKNDKKAIRQEHYNFLETGAIEEKKIAIDILSNIDNENPNLFGKLTQKLSSETDEILICKIITALGNIIENNDDIILLINQLSHPSTLVKKTALGAIESIGKRQPELINESIRSKVFAAISNNLSWIERGTALQFLESLANNKSVEPIWKYDSNPIEIKNILDVEMNKLTNSISLPDAKKAIKAVFKILKEFPIMIDQYIYIIIKNELNSQPSILRSHKRQELIDLYTYIVSLKSGFINDQELERLYDNSTNEMKSAVRLIMSTRANLVRKLLTDLGDIYNQKAELFLSLLVPMLQNNPEVLLECNWVNILTKVAEYIRQSEEYSKQELGIKALGELIVFLSKEDIDSWKRSYKNFNKLIGNIIDYSKSSGPLEVEVKLRAASTKTIGQVTTYDKSLISDISDIIKSRLKDSIADLGVNNEIVRLSALEAISIITRKNPELITKEICNNVINLLRDTSFDIRMAATSVLGNIMQNPNLLTINEDAYEYLIANLERNMISEKEIQQILNALSLIAKNHHTIIKRSIYHIIFYTIDYDDFKVKTLEIIGYIGKYYPEFISRPLYDKIIDIAFNNNANQDVHNAAKETLKIINNVIPEYKNSQPLNNELGENQKTVVVDAVIIDKMPKIREVTAKMVSINIENIIMDSLIYDKFKTASRESHNILPLINSGISGISEGARVKVYKIIGYTLHKKLNFVFSENDKIQDLKNILSNIISDINSNNDELKNSAIFLSDILIDTINQDHKYRIMVRDILLDSVKYTDRMLQNYNYPWGTAKGDWYNKEAISIIIEILEKTLRSYPSLITKDIFEILISRFSTKNENELVRQTSITTFLQLIRFVSNDLIKQLSYYKVSDICQGIINILKNDPNISIRLEAFNVLIYLYEHNICDNDVSYPQVMTINFDNSSPEIRARIIEYLFKHSSIIERSLLVAQCMKALSDDGSKFIAKDTLINIINSKPNQEDQLIKYIASDSDIIGLSSFIHLCLMSLSHPLVLVKKAAENELKSIINKNPEYIEEILVFAEHHTDAQKQIKNILEGCNFFTPKKVSDLFSQCANTNKFIRDNAINILLKSNYTKANVQNGIDHLISSGMSLNELTIIEARIRHHFSTQLNSPETFLSILVTNYYNLSNEDKQLVISLQKQLEYSKDDNIILAGIKNLANMIGITYLQNEASRIISNAGIGQFVAKSGITAIANQTSKAINNAVTLTSNTFNSMLGKDNNKNEKNILQDLQEVTLSLKTRLITNEKLLKSIRDIIIGKFIRDNDSDSLARFVFDLSHSKITIEFNAKQLIISNDEYYVLTENFMLEVKRVYNELTNVLQTTPVPSSISSSTKDSSPFLITSLVDQSELSYDLWKLTVLRNEYKDLVLLELRAKTDRIIEIISSDLREFGRKYEGELKDRQFKEFIQKDAYIDYIGRSYACSIEITQIQKANLFHLINSAQVLAMNEKDKYKEAIKRSLGNDIYEKLYLDFPFEQFKRIAKIVNNYDLIGISRDEANGRMHTGTRSDISMLDDVVLEHNNRLNAQNERHTKVTENMNALAANAKPTELRYVSDIIYDNPMLNHPNFLEILQIAKVKGGGGAETELMNLQDYRSVELLKMKTAEEIVDKIIEQNFFLNNAQGREFIESVASNFDEQTLLSILELGRDQDVAEQIISEIGMQDTSMVVYTLLGKELPISSTTDNLENIIDREELDQLRIVPNGILNNWSNKAKIYQKMTKYIDHLAKNLDEMLNTGKIGNQVAITVALLEDLLSFAASGQRFIGGMPPYYDPNNDDDWLNGGSDGGNDGNNNSGSNANGFTSLILPLYNGTDYNITDYQI